MQKMKNSGVPWIGEIPKGWEVKKIKHLCNVKRGASPRPIDDPKYFDENGTRFWIRISDITKANKYLLSCEQKLSPLGISCSVPIGEDAFFVSICASVGKPCISKVKACIHDGFVVLDGLDKKLNNYFYYLFETELPFAGLGKMGTQLNLNSQTIGNISIPYHDKIPSIMEFLNKKCTQLDDAIAKEKELIEKLKEYRQSIITEAVTKGLNPTAPMKDSGIDWIGGIPKHWGVSKIKYEFDNLDSMRQPISASERGNIEGVYDYYGASGVIDKIDKYIFDEPLLLIGEDGANLIMRNLPLIYKAQGKFWVNNHAHILRPHHKNILGYWFYSLECLDLTNFISGSAQPKLTQEKLSSIQIVVPSKEEQQEITTYLDRKTSLIDNAIQKKEELISKLEQYKKSLIYETVTGKIRI